jgi:hypothetical protein
MAGIGVNLLWLLLAVVLGLIASSLWSSYALEMLTVAVLLSAGATIELWRRAARRPERLKKKFLKQLWRSEPITPKHEPPPPLKADAYGVWKEQLQFFSDFEDFANVVNSWLASPYAYAHSNSWRLQELPKSELGLWASHAGPTYGRTYAVFHNQIRIGEMEIKPGRNYSTESPHVRAHVELDWVRLLHFWTIRGFLTDIALHISKYHPGTLEYLQINQEIDLAMIGVLWRTQEISQFGMDDEPSHGELEMEFGGLASYYLDQREHKEIRS